MRWWLTCRLRGTDCYSSGPMHGYHMRSGHRIGELADFCAGWVGVLCRGMLLMDVLCCAVLTNCLFCCALCVCSVRYAVTLWFFDTEERKLAEAAEQDAS